jgi:phosphatidylserine/phosphatidylglycerophosphate/cardiolipin synthase-like enzyme
MQAPDHRDISSPGPLTPSVLCIFGLLAFLLAGAIAWGVASGQDVGTVAGTGAQPTPGQPVAVVARVEILHSPHGGCGERVIKEIDAAKAWVRILAYSFTSRPIAAALIAAKERGVDVAVVVDRSQPAQHSSQIGALKAAGVPVFIDSSHPIQHQKVVVIDGKTTTLGSWNLSTQAESNSENLAVCPDSAPLAAHFAANWSLHAGHSEKYKGAPQKAVGAEVPNPDAEPSGEGEPGANQAARPHSLIDDIDSGICSDPERHIEEAVEELAGRKASLGDGVNP